MFSVTYYRLRVCRLYALYVVIACLGGIRSVASVLGRPWRPHAHQAPLYDGRRIAPRGGGVPHDRVRDPQSRRLGGVRAAGRRGSGRLVAGCLRRPRPKILPQGRHRGPAQAGARGRRAGVAVAQPAGPGGRERRGRRRRQADPRRALGQGGLPPPRRHLDLLGLEGRLLRRRAGRPRLLRRARHHAGGPGGRAELAAVVQHRPELGLRHRRPGPGPLLRRPRERRAEGGRVGLRAPPAARLLHPEHPGRPRQRGRDHGPLGARGAALQVRLGHRHQLLQPARRGRGALRRGQVLRPDELPQDRRPRRRRHQVGRHHPTRRQDGHRRRRPPRHRGLRLLEGGGGAEGRGAGERIAAPAHTPQRDRRCLPRGQRRRALRAQVQPGAQRRSARGAQGAGAGELHPPGDPLGRAGLHRDRLPHLRHRLAVGGLPHGLGPELQQLDPRHR